MPQASAKASVALFKCSGSILSYYFWWTKALSVVGYFFDEGSKKVHTGYWGKLVGWAMPSARRQVARLGRTLSCLRKICGNIFDLAVRVLLPARYSVGTCKLVRVLTARNSTYSSSILVTPLLFSAITIAFTPTLLHSVWQLLLSSSSLLQLYNK